VCYLRVSLLSFSLLFSGPGAFGGGATTVYFVPFEIDTYVPITRATIISDAWEKWVISSNSETSRLFTLLSNGPEDRFDENNVRGLVLSDNESYLIDSNGVVLKGKLSIRIDKAQFVRFKDSLRPDQRQVIRKGSSSK